MKIVVLGTGYVAQAYLRELHYLGYHPLVLSRSWLDYTDPGRLKFCLSVFKPDVVINCAGYTGRTVDDCESNAQTCFEANTLLPGRIAEVCHELGAALIHISSGCLFNGAGPFKEDDGEDGVPNFCDGTYQRTKLFGEQRVSTSCDRYWIFRLRMPFSHVYHPRNLLCKLMTYERILDGLNSLTFLDEFAQRSWQLFAKKSPPGIYHAAYSDSITTMEVAQMLWEARLRTLPVVEYPKEEFLKDHVPRSSAVLDSSKFEKTYGTPFGDVRCALRWCINELGRRHCSSPPPPPQMERRVLQPS